MLFTTILLVSLHLSALSARLDSRRPKTPGLDLCPSAFLTDSRAVNVGGHTIQHSTFACPDDSLSKASLAAKSTVDNVTNDISRRSVAECRASVPECQCGQQTSGKCKNWTSSAPTGNDCAILLDGLQVVAEQTGATFLVANNSMDLLTFQTCAVGFVNLGTFQGATSIEYCWDELRSDLGVLYQNCIASGASTSVENIANNGFWLQHLLTLVVTPITSRIFRFSP
ncbi:uncharacterized protein FOMMEDRAFT_30504 [Fomitiporia mediterranea MF3/22]|uniref:uncharacterized protein n=1 Tax=Fomitiporia mediterranea (strain MF3/22) TaxID=694068 RepID=UPI00044089E9|nr:uncharacterized protein FOMMEDRAFT_30504 [Fomitiporia mediterranea MF3/22]EJD00472.1 hypothetical protein FOMMEDRAFT_30504 [Fomitiporia mediterranea MF3/22]